MAATKTVVSSEEEEILLTVPEELTRVPLGFTLDAGGSQTNIVYRSKEDYRNGKRIGNAESGEGLLRLRYFRSGEDEELISFIREHCDVMESASEVNGWFHTGNYTHRFKDRLEEVIGTKVKTISESDAIYKALKGFYPRVAACRPLGLAVDPVGRALETVKGFMLMIQGSREMGDHTFDDIEAKVDPQVTAEYGIKLMTRDGASWAEELSQYVIEWPCLSVTCGSADSMLFITEEGKCESFHSGISGKTFYSLGEALCGAEDFDDLIEMAGRGDPRKVDTMSGDMKVKDRKEVDWYAVMPDTHVIFTMGKLAEDSYKGTYTKEDMAAGLVHMIASFVAKYASATARMTKASSVVVTGSFVSHQLVRETLQKWMLEDSLLQPLFGEEQIKWVFPPYPDFISAIGTWYRNWELEQERRSR